MDTHKVLLLVTFNNFVDNETENALQESHIKNFSTTVLPMCVIEIMKKTGNRFQQINFIQVMLPEHSPNLVNYIRNTTPFHHAVLLKQIHRRNSI